MKRCTLLILVTLVTAAVSSPAHLRRQDTSSSDSSPLAFVNDDGSIDYASLLSAAQINPPDVIPALPTNETVPIDQSALLQQSVSQADQQISNTSSTATDGTNSKRKRATTYIYGPTGCGTEVNTTTKDTSVPQHLSDTTFQNNAALSNFAKNAVTPNGFVGAYSNQNGVYTSQSGVSSFLGMDTLGSYDVQFCATKCQNGFSQMCQAFNIYFERDPSIDCQDPAIESKYASQYHPDYNTCKDPPALTNIVCTYWSTPITLAGATNTGQFRGSAFKVQEAGSNGYNLAPAAPVFPGIAPAKEYSGKVDNRVGAPALLSVSVDASQGASAATCATLATGRYKGVAKSFSSFYIYKFAKGTDHNNPANGVYQGLGCLIYKATDFADASFNDRGQYDGAGNYYLSSPVFHYASLPAQ